MRTATRTGSECFSMELGLLLPKPYDSLCVKTTISPQKGCSSNRKIHLDPLTGKNVHFYLQRRSHTTSRIIGNTCFPGLTTVSAESCREWTVGRCLYTVLSVRRKSIKDADQGVRYDLSTTATTKRPYDQRLHLQRMGESRHLEHRPLDGQRRDPDRPCPPHRKWRRNYKDLVAGMGYQVNPGRTGNRWQQKVNGVMRTSTNWFDRFNPMLLRPKRAWCHPDQCREGSSKRTTCR